jgi:hypothetical protein
MNPTTPQAVTERYVSNLLSNGQNKEFRINEIKMAQTFVGNENVGIHFIVQVTNFHITFDAIGATPSQALHRSLEKHGVTFR